jgi:hypothetical protein
LFDTGRETDRLKERFSDQRGRVYLGESAHGQDDALPGKRSTSTAIEAEPPRCQGQKNGLGVYAPFIEIFINLSEYWPNTVGVGPQIVYR